MRVSFGSCGAIGNAGRTIIDLLQCDNCVGWQALLGVVVEEEGLGGDLSCLARGRHGGVAGGVHGMVR